MVKPIYDWPVSPKFLWEILIPCQMVNVNGDTRPVRTKHHRVWDAKVREISGGLTILRPAIGHWVSPQSELFVERMIPVRVFCTKEQIERISDWTAKHYNQLAVMFYAVSSEITIKHYDKTNV